MSFDQKHYSNLTNTMLSMHFRLACYLNCDRSDSIRLFSLMTISQIKKVEWAEFKRCWRRGFGTTGIERTSTWKCPRWPPRHIYSVSDDWRLTTRYGTQSHRNCHKRVSKRKFCLSGFGVKDCSDWTYEMSTNSSSPVQPAADRFVNSAIRKVYSTEGSLGAYIQVQYIRNLQRRTAGICSELYFVVFVRIWRCPWPTGMILLNSKWTAHDY